MNTRRSSIGKGRVALAVLAAASVTIAIPSTGLAVVSGGSSPLPKMAELLPFTPAGADPKLAAKVAEVIGEDALRFTPASKPQASYDRTVNFAVRVDSGLAESIAGVARQDSLASSARGASSIVPVRYNLGIARGYQSFAPPAKPALSSLAGVRDISAPDLSDYQDKGVKVAGKPSRFQSRITLETRDRAGSTPRTIEGAGSQQLDLGGSYRLSRNFDVTAGVRVSQDRDRLRPLTNKVGDDQAVYVGTQIRF